MIGNVRMRRRVGGGGVGGGSQVWPLFSQQIDHAHSVVRRTTVPYHTYCYMYLMMLVILLTPGNYYPMDPIPLMSEVLYRMSWH